MASPDTWPNAQVGDFAYPEARGSAAEARSLWIYSDRAGVRRQWCEDAETAGLHVQRVGTLADVLGGDQAVRSTDLIVLDCPETNAETVAQLAWLDMRLAKAGAQALVTTSLDALDHVFGCFDQSGPEILVNPTRPERVIALSRTLARMPGMVLQEMSQDDRVMLLRLTEQVEQLAERLDLIGGSEAKADPPSDDAKVKSPALAFAAQDSGSRDVIRLSEPALPDARLVRKIIRQRQQRARFFDSEIFADPAWDMLLDLTAAKAENAKVCVTSLCIASGVPPTTALRWITQMVDAGLFERVEDESDRRRAFIQLSQKAADAMARYFGQLGSDAVALA